MLSNGFRFTESKLQCGLNDPSNVLGAFHYTIIHPTVRAQTETQPPKRCWVLKINISNRGGEINLAGLNTHGCNSGEPQAAGLMWSLMREHKPCFSDRSHSMTLGRELPHSWRQLWTAGSGTVAVDEVRMFGSLDKNQ